MIKRDVSNDCAPAQYRINAKKPTRSGSNGVFIKQSKEFELFGFSIFKTTTLLIGQGMRKIKPKTYRNEITLWGLVIAILVALICAIGIEIIKTSSAGILLEIL